jgi:hypothetical protein
MDLQQRAAIEAACQHLTSAYCHYIDRGEARRVVALFTEDAEWAAPEGVVKGRKSKHICTNFWLEDVSETEASGGVYLTLYRDDGDPERERARVNGPVLVGEYRDKYLLTNNGWRIAKRSVQVDFVFNKR